MTFHQARITASAAVLIALVFLVSCGGGDDPAAPEPGPTPIILSLSDSILSSGDVLSIKGKNFTTVATSNRVVFNNSLAMATPFFASGESLAVVVPQNANSGGMYVTSSGVRSTTRNVTIQRGIGDVWVMGGGAQYDFDLPASSGTERYLLITHPANTTGARFGYTIAPETAAAFSAPPDNTVNRVAGMTDFGSRFEIETRREAVQYIQRHGGDRRPLEQAQSSLSPPAVATFKVLKCASCSTTNPANYTDVTANLVYQGTTAHIYADADQPSGSFTQADYDAFGAQFDNEIVPTDTTFFGPPTDVNNDGHITILFSPRVNDLTPDGTAQQNGFISGFFLLIDLAPGIFPSGTSNSMEIFYAMVPDPNNEYGNTFSKPQVAGIIPGTLAHEFEHMISFGYRFLEVGNGTNLSFTQTTWLEEGMAHMAEDLNNMDNQNILRSNRYLMAPGQTSLVGNVELQPFVDTLEQRGAIFLFLRYLGDQFGTDIYKEMVQSGCIGRSCIEGATGRDFHALVADFLVTLYLSDRNIPHDAKYDFSSLDFPNDFGPLQVTTRTVSEGTFGTTVRSVSGDFYQLTGGQSPAINLGVTDSNNGKVRVAIVRIQ